ncbi:M16 family metallopeptidase [Piscinibacter sp.]|uniref:M16 family metallopeptidase n=1 Tax=Piscinibacter sp. TaxID=1903157 RepID=UPI002C1FEA7E|nr:pitrilysin family protein [Albitalea sp.]HUG22265.1 pitrilysin family protein [Albitalea sp.]
MIHRLVCFALFVWVAVVPVSAQPLPPGVAKVTSVEGIDEYRLPNGLRVLLVPDASKPTTTVNLTLRVGSRHEGYGETGMAHLLEHMIFKGTPKHPKVWAEFQKRGLRANGSTGFDRTNYTASFSANEDNLNWYVGWLADAMVNSFIARKDLDTEMTVVRNEMEMGENNPQRVLYQKTLAMMFDWHNYGNAIIGARTDVENVDIPNLQAFYRLYYQPDNAVLVVAGAFDTAKLLSTVAKTFGRIKKPTRKLPILYTLDPAQDGERSLTLRRVGGAPFVYAGYHIPGAAAPDFAATEVLALVMGDTPSGRLHKRLTEKQLAAGTFAFSQGLADPGLAIFGAQLSPGQAIDRSRDELVATLESTLQEPVTDEEVKRAQAKWLNGWEQSFTNPEAVGLALSESVAQGDWRLFFLLRDRVRDVKTAEVQRVASLYLLPSNRTLATYQPTEKPQRPPAPLRVDVAEQMKTFKPQAAAASVEAFVATPENIDRRTQRVTIGGVKAALLPKGTRGDAVQAVLTLHYGDEKSLFGSGEVPNLVAAMLDKGTQTMTREQVQDRLDELKTQLYVDTGLGEVSFSLVSRREHLPAAIELIGEMLRKPAMPPDALDEVKRQALTGIEQQRKEPRAVAANAVARTGNPYPRGDVRYARTFDEMAADVSAVTMEQVRDFHSRFYGARRGEFAAVGAMDADAVQRALQKALGDWDSGLPYTRVPQPIVPVPPQRMVLQVPDKQNATMLVKLDIPLSDNDADYPALMLANHLLGSGGSSRLWKRIREGEGLSYDVRSVIHWSSVEPHSSWLSSAIFAPENQPKVEAALKDELARVLKDGFTAQELAEGRAGLLNFRRLSRAQDGSVAGLWARHLYVGRTFAKTAEIDAALEKLSLAEVNAALRKYILPEQAVSAYAGDFKP